MDCREAGKSDAQKTGHAHFRTGTRRLGAAGSHDRPSKPRESGGR
jgi:hypothetical protein